jgi:hypothetical protein
MQYSNQIIAMIKSNHSRTVLQHSLKIESHGKKEGREAPSGLWYFFLFPFFFFHPLLLSPIFSFLSRHREGGKERTADAAHGDRGS